MKVKEFNELFLKAFMEDAFKTREALTKAFSDGFYRDQRRQELENKKVVNNIFIIFQKKQDKNDK